METVRLRVLPPPPPRPSGDEGGDALAPLADAVRRGEPGALESLLRALAPLVAKVVAGVLGRDHPDGDDVAQATLIALVKALPQFRGEAPVGRFARRIAVRTALTMRADRRARTAREEPRDDADTDDARASVDQVLRRRRLAAWQALLDELPPAQAEVLVLRFVMELSLEETAEVVQAPVNTVRSRVRLAREAIKRRLDTDPALSELLDMTGEEAT